METEKTVDREESRDRDHLVRREGGEMGDEGASGHKSGSRLIISATGPPAPGIHHHQPTETIILFMKNQIYKLLQIVLQFV